jgi:hypothetical protein
MAGRSFCHLPCPARFATAAESLFLCGPLCRVANASPWFCLLGIALAEIANDIKELHKLASAEKTSG